MSLQKASMKIVYIFVAKNVQTKPVCLDMSDNFYEGLTATYIYYKISKQNLCCLDVSGHVHKMLSGCLMSFRVMAINVWCSLDSVCPCLQFLHMPLPMSDMDWLFVELKQQDELVA